MEDFILEDLIFEPKPLAEIVPKRAEDSPPAPPKRWPAQAGQKVSPPVTLLGVLFHPRTLAQAVAEVDRMIESGRPHYIVTANVDFLVQARKDAELRRILLEADLVLCDGTPLVWMSRWLGNGLPERVAGADLAPVLIQRAVEKQYRVFFLGGAPQVTYRAVAALESKYPGLNIAGYYSPPFRPLLEMDHEEIAGRIRAAAPDLVLVSFGCPKAEKWMAMHYRALGVPVMIGVGGTIDFLAGEKRRAPAWMQRSGTEWVFRMMQEPQRLARRYLKDCWRFLPAVFQQWWVLQRGARGAEPGPGCAITMTMKEPTWLRLRVPSRLDRQVVVRDGELGDEVRERHCLVDLANVTFIDSTALAWLIQVQQNLRAGGWQLVLLDPSPQVQRALRCQKLDSFFLCARDILEARELIQPEAQNAVRLTTLEKVFPA